MSQQSQAKQAVQVKPHSRQLASGEIVQIPSFVREQLKNIMGDTLKVKIPDLKQVLKDKRYDRITDIDNIDIYVEMWGDKIENEGNTFEYAYPFYHALKRREEIAYELSIKQTKAASEAAGTTASEITRYEGMYQNIFDRLDQVYEKLDEGYSFKKDVNQATQFARSYLLDSPEWMYMRVIAKEYQDKYLQLKEAEREETQIKIDDAKLAKVEKDVEKRKALREKAESYTKETGKSPFKGFGLSADFKGWKPPEPKEKPKEEDMEVDPKTEMLTDYRQISEQNLSNVSLKELNEINNDVMTSYENYIENHIYKYEDFTNDEYRFYQETLQTINDVRDERKHNLFIQNINDDLDSKTKLSDKEITDIKYINDQQNKLEKLKEDLENEENSKRYSGRASKIKILKKKIDELQLDIDNSYERFLSEGERREELLDEFTETPTTDMVKSIIARRSTSEDAFDFTEMRNDEFKATARPKDDTKVEKPKQKSIDEMGLKEQEAWFRRETRGRITAKNRDRFDAWVRGKRQDELNIEKGRQDQFKKETGKRSTYKGNPTKAYVKWSEENPIEEPTIPQFEGKLERGIEARKIAEQNALDTVVEFKNKVISAKKEFDDKYATEIEEGKKFLNSYLKMREADKDATQDIIDHVEELKAAKKSEREAARLEKEKQDDPLKGLINKPYTEEQKKEDFDILFGEGNWKDSGIEDTSQNYGTEIEVEKERERVKQDRLNQLNNASEELKGIARTERAKYKARKKLLTQGKYGAKPEGGHIPSIQDSLTSKYYDEETGKKVRSAKAKREYYSGDLQKALYKEKRATKKIERDILDKVYGRK